MWRLTPALRNEKSRIRTKEARERERSPADVHSRKSRGIDGASVGAQLTRGT